MREPTAQKYGANIWGLGTILLTGNTLLASSIGYEWTVWQNGYPDFLMVNKAVATAAIPIAIGVLICIFVFALMLRISVRKKRLFSAFVR